jgi:hypothetical protein
MEKLQAAAGFDSYFLSAEGYRWLTAGLDAGSLGTGEISVKLERVSRN